MNRRQLSVALAVLPVGNFTLAQKAALVEGIHSNVFIKPRTIAMLDVAANKNVLRQFLTEVWSNGDIAACDRYIAAKYTVLHDPGDPWDKRELDLAGYKERVALSRAPFPDQVFTIQELVGEGQKVVVSWLWSATHKGDIPGFPATGKRINMSGITVYSFEEGRLIGHWQVADRLGVYGQLRQGV